MLKIKMNISRGFVDSQRPTDRPTDRCYLLIAQVLLIRNDRPTNPDDTSESHRFCWFATTDRPTPMIPPNQHRFCWFATTEFTRMRKWGSGESTKEQQKELEVLYHLPVLIHRTLKGLILWTFTYHIIACQVVEKQ
jgi:hypothetical protein